MINPYIQIADSKSKEARKGDFYSIKILIQTCYFVTGLHLSDIVFNTFIPHLYPIFKAFPTNAISMDRGRKIIHIICLFVAAFTSFCHSLSHSSVPMLHKTVGKYIFISLKCQTNFNILYCSTLQSL